MNDQSRQPTVPPPVVRGVLPLIGNTPLVKLETFDTGPCELFVKLENANPGGSIKDRIGLSMIEAAEKSGAIKRGDRRHLLGKPGTAALLVATAMLTRKSLAKTWEAVGDKPAPPDEDNAEVDLREAVAWALLSGAAVGLARLFARRYIAYRGSSPRGTPVIGRGAKH